MPRLKRVTLEAATPDPPSARIGQARVSITDPDSGQHPDTRRCISPGAIVTPIFWRGYRARSEQEDDDGTERLIKHLQDRLPQKRAGRPEDIAHAAVYLASDESLHTAAHNPTVDAGLMARPTPREQLDESRALRARQIAEG